MAFATLALLGTFCAEPVNQAVHQYAVQRLTPNYINSYWATEHGGIVWGRCHGNADQPLRADTRWAPNETDVQRGRAVLLETFNQPHNLPPAEFAKLADKSRQQIYKDILARRLLALNVGPRGQKLPDW